MNGLLRDFLPLIRGSVGDWVPLVFRSADTDQTCRIDPHELEVAVLNLGINARDANPCDGEILLEISERCEDEAVFTCITVRDNGSGMPAEICERAIEPFFTTKDVGAGTGLGLSQVYGFANQGGGRLEIDSAVDRGRTMLNVHNRV